MGAAVKAHSDFAFGDDDIGGHQLAGDWPLPSDNWSAPQWCRPCPFSQAPPLPRPARQSERRCAPRGTNASVRREAHARCFSCLWRPSLAHNDQFQIKRSLSGDAALPVPKAVTARASAKPAMTDGGGTKSVAIPRSGPIFGELAPALDIEQLPTIRAQLAFGIDEPIERLAFRLPN